MAEKPVKEVVEELLERVTKLENSSNSKEWKRAYSGSIRVSANSVGGISAFSLSSYADEIKSGAPFIINTIPASNGVACCSGIDKTYANLYISCVNNTSSAINIDVEVLIYC